MQRRINPVYKVINKPLTVMGVERGMFFAGLGMSMSTWSATDSLLGGVLFFLVVLIGGRIATAKDPKFLRIVINAGRLKRFYDPLKIVPTQLEIIDRAQEEGLAESNDFRPEPASGEPQRTEEEVREAGWADGEGAGSASAEACAQGDLVRVAAHA